MERLVDLLRESESLGATAAVLRARLKCAQSRLKCAEHDLFGGSYPLHAAVQRKDTGKCIKISFLACAQSPAPRARSISLSLARAPFVLLSGLHYLPASLTSFYRVY